MILIQETMDGNQGAQKILYDKYRKIIKDYLHNKYRQYSDIDDDVSEIIIKVFLNLSSYDETKAKFKSWVLFIARNHMVDKWRAGSITLTSFNSEVTTDTISCSNFNVDDNVSLTLSNSEKYSSNNTADFEACNSLSFISSQLSASDYTMLNMKYLHGFNYSEIGAEFNLTSNTVSNKVNYIKTKLKKNYSDIYEE